MLTIINNIITMTKGDSVSFGLPLVTGVELNTQPIDLTNIEKIQFNIVAPNQPSEEAFIKKEYTPNNVDEEGKLNIEIMPEDTEDLPTGTYYYEVKLLNETTEYVYTIIPRRLFYIIK